jgi:hypothetical protein
VAISVELNDFSDLEIHQEIERAIRDCIGVRPNEEEWKVWIRASGIHCEIKIKGPTQTREKFFFEDGHPLGERIRKWLLLYPLQ